MNSDCKAIAVGEQIVMDLDGSTRARKTTLESEAVLRSATEFLLPNCAQRRLIRKSESIQRYKGQRGIDGTIDSARSARRQLAIPTAAGGGSPNWHNRYSFTGRLFHADVSLCTVNFLR